MPGARLDQFFNITVILLKVMWLQKQPFLPCDLAIPRHSALNFSNQIGWSSITKQIRRPKTRRKMQRLHWGHPASSLLPDQVWFFLIPGTKISPGAVWQPGLMVGLYQNDRRICAVML
jgi:hypothetical protein